MAICANEAQPIRFLTFVGGNLRFKVSNKLVPKLRSHKDNKESWQNRAEMS